MGFTTAKLSSYAGLPIKVTPRVGVPKDRVLITMVGIRSRYRLGVHNNSLGNVLRGLVERVYQVERNGVLAPPPAPEPNVFKHLTQFAQQVSAEVGGATPWSYEEFILSCRGSKRRLYANAVDSLQRSPLARKDAKLKTFVKAEKIDLESKADPAPRLIQPRSPRYNAWVGRYLKSIEHRIYDAIDRQWGMETVMSGYNALDVARLLRKHWDRRNDIVAIGLDASRFDQHVSAEALEWEHSVYNDIYKDPRLAEVLSWQIVNRGTAFTPEGVVTYQVKGKRMSGDMNTSLGNKLLMCAMVHQYVKMHTLNASLANNGDDCVLFVPKHQVKTVQKTLAPWFTRMGFTMKMEEPVSVFEQIEFCQQRPVDLGASWIMSRSPYKGVAKDVTMISPDPSALLASYRSWAAGVGAAGNAIYGGLPVVRELYKKMSTLSSKKVAPDTYSGIGAAAKNVNRQWDEPTAVCRSSYYLAWGVTPHMQVLLEQMIRDMPLDLQSLYPIAQVDHLAIT